MRLKRNFFNRDTLIVARELLGKYLVRKIGPKIIRAKITETEAYCGPNDLANHASKGMTPRNKVMFGSPGHTYIYLVYGMYHCLNIVTEKKGYPAAVLIRGVELDGMNGPGKICRGLKIDKTLNGIDVSFDKRLWLESASWRRRNIPKNKIKKSKRIGVDYAGKWKDKPWRFTLT